MLVTTDQGPGVLDRCEGEDCFVHFFDLPQHEGGGRLERVPAAQVERHVLRSRSRVWFAQEGRAVAGLVVKSLGAKPGGLLDYEINALDGRPPVSVCESSIIPLRNSGRLNPIDLLKLEIADNPSFTLMRSELFHRRADLLAASGRVTALLSAPVELHDHQVGVVTTVLADPVQRYLLADEVGLGKTIEALLILRQWLIEEPGHRCLIAAPEVLVQQWEEEIRRLRVHDLSLDGQVVVATHGDALSAYLATDFDSMILDEAHRLGALSAGEWAAASRRATSVERLLLLSATPVRSNESGFLRLLQLLDPEVYEQVTEESFRNRVEARQGLSNLIARLRPRAPAFLLRGALNEVPEMVDHPAAIGLAQQAIEAFESDDDDGARELVHRLRSIVSESHRIHRRMLRNRRAECASFSVRGRVLRPDDVLVSSTTLEARDQWLEGFGEQLWILVEDGHLTEAAAIRTFRVVAARVLADRVAVLRLCDFLEDAPGPGLPVAEAGLIEAILEHQDVVESLQELVTIVRREEEDDDSHIDLAVSRLAEELEGYTDAFSDDWHEAAWRKRRGNPLSFDVGAADKVVVFTNFPEVAAAFVERLRERFPRAEAAVITRDIERGEVERILKRFGETSPLLAIVGDDVIAEGLNLQNAACCIHLDMPFDTNRLEQRIGRLDRKVSQDDPGRARSVVIQPPSPAGGDDSVGLAGVWHLFLRDAVRIFDQSAAILQYALADLEDRLLRTFMAEGADSTREMIPEVAADAEQHREEIRAQDDLDAVDFTADHTLIDMAQLKDVAGSLAPFMAALTTVAIRMLGFNTEHREAGTRLVESQLGAMLSLEELLKRFPDALKEFGSVDRAEAVREGRRLWAPGDPLADRICEFLESDDRGVVGAAILQDGGRPFIRLSLDLEAALPEGADPWLVRSVASVLRPRHVTRWIAPDGSVLSPLEGQRREASLATLPLEAIRRDLDGLVPSDWAAHLRTAATTCIEAVQSESAHLTHHEEAVGRAAHLVHRHQVVADIRPTPDHLADVERAEHVLWAVRRATYRIDTACVLFL